MPRPLMLAGLLGAAVGVPYAIDHSDEWQAQLTKYGETTSAAKAPDAAWSPPGDMKRPEIPSPDSPGDLLFSSPAPLEGIPTHSLAEVLRLDVTKDWIYQRWARKSTGLAEPELFGIRVPLVSGTRMTDVAGSLTYYFNVAGGVDRIALTGQTADTRELVNLLVQRYGFEPQTPRLAGEQLFQVKHQGRVASELRTWPASVLWATSPHSSFQVELEINRPGSGRFVEHKPLMLQAVEQPPPAPKPLFGEQQPTGTPVLPGERIVPSATGPTTGAPRNIKSPKPAVEPVAPPKKLPPPVLRWPN